MRTCQFHDGEPCTNIVEGNNFYCATHGRLMRKAEHQAKKDYDKLLKKLSTPKKIYSPPKKVSEKQKEKNAEYSARVKEWKKENPNCAAKISSVCTGKTEDCHHQKKRGDLLMVEKYWIPVCRACHQWIGDNAEEARNRGLTINHLEPEFIEPHKI
jgi:hypothetical protein